MWRLFESVAAAVQNPTDGSAPTAAPFVLHSITKLDGGSVLPPLVEPIGTSYEALNRMDGDDTQAVHALRDHGGAARTWLLNWAWRLQRQWQTTAIKPLAVFQVRGIDPAKVSQDPTHIQLSRPCSCVAFSGL